MSVFDTTPKTCELMLKHFIFTSNTPISRLSLADASTGQLIKYPFVSSRSKMYIHPIPTLRAGNLLGMYC